MPHYPSPDRPHMTAIARLSYHGSRAIRGTNDSFKSLFWEVLRLPEDRTPPHLSPSLAFRMVIGSADVPGVFGSWLPKAELSLEHSLRREVGVKKKAQQRPRRGVGINHFEMRSLQVKGREECRDIHVLGRASEISQASSVPSQPVCHATTQKR